MQLIHFTKCRIPHWVTRACTYLLSYSDCSVSRGAAGGESVWYKNMDVIKELLHEYCERTPICQKGLENLYDRAENRGYGTDA